LIMSAFSYNFSMKVLEVISKSIFL